MIKVVAKSIVKDDKIEEFKSYAEELASETRKEEGCISYQLFQDVNNSKILTFIEEWESLDSLQNHMKTKHFVEIVPKLDVMKEKDSSELNIYRLEI